MAECIYLRSKQLCSKWCDIWSSQQGTCTQLHTHHLQIHDRIKLGAKLDEK